jgi:hypothetical protein
LKLIGAVTTIIAIKMIFIKSIVNYKCTNSQDPLVPHQNISDIHFGLSLQEKVHAISRFHHSLPFSLDYLFFPFDFFIGCQMEFIF